MRLPQLILSILVLLTCCTSKAPDVRSFVIDLEDDLDSVAELRFDSLFRAHEKLTGNEILLVTTPDMGGHQKMLDFAVEFGHKHGVGKKDRDNGVTIAFSKTRRAVFIATGYGTEEVLHDSICQRIVDTEMLPRFKEDDEYGGLWAGSLAVVAFLDRPENRIR